MDTAAAQHEDTYRKEVQGFVTVILKLLERWNEIWQVNRKDPVISQKEPEEEEEAEEKVDVIFVRILPLGIYIVVIIINHHGLGQKPPHPGGVVQ